MKWYHYLQTVIFGPILLLFGFIETIYELYKNKF
jgi:hypothetical protein